MTNAATDLAQSREPKPGTDTDLALELGRLNEMIRALPDPEIPVITLGDLGIVRRVGLEGANPVVSLTPTYSGCPATEAIRDTVAQTLRDAGYPNPQVDIVLAPPWSTSWISEQGRRKLHDYGIAPPLDDELRAQHAAQRLAGDTRLPPTKVVSFYRKLACPRCGANDVEQLSAYGSTPCKSLYRCRACREPFDYFKPY